MGFWVYFAFGRVGFLGREVVEEKEVVWERMILIHYGARSVF